MLKHLAHAHHSKLHTFDDFYNENNAKLIKSNCSSNNLISTASHPVSPTLTCSPSNTPYTFYNIFSDFKSSTTPEAVIEEEEEKSTESENLPTTPIFYIEDDQQNHTHSSPSSSSSPHWPTFLNRFRHTNSTHQQQQQQQPVTKQMSLNEGTSHSAKMRKNEFSDLSTNKRRFIKRSETLTNAAYLNEKKSPNDDFPQLFAALSPSPSAPNSATSTGHISKKNRSFASLFHHFHHHHHHHHHHHPHSPQPKSNSNPNLAPKSDTLRPKLCKQKTLPANAEVDSPVKKSPSTPILPKLTALFARHHLSDHYKYRVGNIKARLHHRRNSPPLTNSTPRFHCQVSTELIQQVQQSEEQQEVDQYVHPPRSAKPVIMKRVHTWHNNFDLRPLDQCLEY